MSMFEIPEGAWLAYQLTTTESGKPKMEPKVEKYTFVKIAGEDCTVDVERNGEPVGTIQTKTSFGCYLFDFSGLEKKGSENLNTNFGHFYVNIYEGKEGDASVRMYIAKDNIVLRRVLSYTKGDSLYSESRELCWASIRI